jgi:RimJ/RimL family protein N-acetyltransferase
VFTCDGVTLRPLGFADIERLYAWHIDGTVDRYSGWTRRRARETYESEWVKRILEPPADAVFFGIVWDGVLVGRLELAKIDRTDRHAAIGVILGDQTAWGKGIATTALRIALDYAFRVENLERVYAHVFGFNERSQRLMTRVGFVHEGVLRQHEVHLGERQDRHIYGMLKDEFAARYETLFAVPGAGR